MSFTKKYSLFRCCTSAPHMPGYEFATDQILARLKTNMVPIAEFGCCGYPLRNIDQMSWILSSARNLALAETQRTSIVTVCNCCYGTLKHCAWLLSQDESLAKQVNKTLQHENLSYSGITRIVHLFELLTKEVDQDSLKQLITNPADNYKLALHYGCRILRPSVVLGMDNPFNPSMLDELVSTVGAKSVDWSRKLDCCGAAIMGTDHELSALIAEDKLDSAQSAGADAVCVACPFCQLRLNTARKNGNAKLPVISYPQLLAHCLGVPDDKTEFKLS